MNRYRVTVRESPNTADAQKILEMIKGADPTDTEKLAEIDARVWAFLNLKGDFRIYFGDGGSIHYRHNSWPEDARTLLHHSFQHDQYTRSRDALKTIRPEGWWFECCKICDGTYMAELHDDRGCIDDDEGITVKAWYLKNEELAELHAIIQAIEYERAQALEAAA